MIEILSNLALHLALFDYSFCEKQNRMQAENLVTTFAKEKDIPIIDELRHIHYCEEIIVPIEIYKLIIKRQPYCISIFKNNNKIIGYYALMGLEDEVIIKLKNKELTEKNLDDINFIPIIREFKNFNNKYIYILSIISKNLKDTNNNFLMIMHLKKRLNYLLSNYSIKGIYTHYENKKLESILQNNTLISNI